MTNRELTAVDDRHLRRSGAIYMSVFAFFWAVGPPPIDGAAARTVVLVSAVCLTALTVVLALRVRGGPPRDLVSDWQRRYNRVVLVELGVIAIVVVALLVLGATEVIAPVVCLVVGLHFLPLATLFRQPAYRWTGVALTGVAALGLVLALTSGGDAGRTVVGFGAAAALWLTSATVAIGRREPVGAEPS